jgi:hypothetical protein
MEFEKALDTRDREKIEKATEKYEKILDKLENNLD